MSVGVYDYLLEIWYVSFLPPLIIVPLVIILIHPIVVVVIVAIVSVAIISIRAKLISSTAISATELIVIVVVVIFPSSSTPPEVIPRGPMSERRVLEVVLNEPLVWEIPSGYGFCIPYVLCNPLEE
jgi:hypothetical protein